LLLLYGFAQPANPHETLMLLCPLPSPDNWDEVFTARMELLQVIGVFHIDVETASKNVDASSCSAVPLGRQVFFLCGSVLKPFKSNSSTCIGVLITVVCCAVPCCTLPYTIQPVALLISNITCPAICVCVVLCQAKGMRPQLFLTASHLEAATGQPLLLAPEAPAPEADSRTAAAAENISSSSSSKKRGSSRRCSIVPDAARQVLEVFVLDKRELASALQQQQSGAAAAAAGSNGSNGSNGDPVHERLQQLGLDMAVLTTFARLLELKLIAMEGEDGTGPLEEDIQQLAAAAAAAAEQQRQSGSRGGVWGGSEGGEGASVPAWKRACLLYRSGQKALVRSYINAARAELQDTLTELQALMEANGYSP
jgi:hypothetical protein